MLAIALLSLGVGSVAVSARLRVAVPAVVRVERAIEVRDRRQQAVERGEDDLERRPLALLEPTVEVAEPRFEVLPLLRVAELTAALADDAAELVEHREEPEHVVGHALPIHRPLRLRLGLRFGLGAAGRAGDRADVRRDAPEPVERRL